jgi:hypothetical protein
VPAFPFVKGSEYPVLGEAIEKESNNSSEPKLQVVGGAKSHDWSKIWVKPTVIAVIVSRGGEEVHDPA